MYSVSGSWTEEVDCIRDGFDSSLTLRGGDNDEREMPKDSAEKIVRDIRRITRRYNDISENYKESFSGFKQIKDDIINKINL